MIEFLLNNSQGAMIAKIIISIALFCLVDLIFQRLAKNK